VHGGAIIGMVFGVQQPPVSGAPTPDISYKILSITAELDTNKIINDFAAVKTKRVNLC